MKNVHLIPTNKQIKNVGDLVKDQYGDVHIFTKNDGKEYGKTTTKLNIYITSDEEIKEGDWVITPTNDIIEWAKVFRPNGKKIILTTNTKLIRYGVQAIDDEFLEWFVKNPSCEEVEVESGLFFYTEGEDRRYKIIIPKEIDILELGQIIPKEEPKQDAFNYSLNAFKVPKEYFGKEEPKQETLEEAVETVEEYFLSNIKNMLQFNNDALAIRFMEKYYHAKQEQERSYSEEEVLDITKQAYSMGRSNYTIKAFNEWFEQFKKK